MNEQEYGIFRSNDGSFTEVLESDTPGGAYLVEYDSSGECTFDGVPWQVRLGSVPHLTEEEMKSAIAYSN